MIHRYTKTFALTVVVTLLGMQLLTAQNTVEKKALELTLVVKKITGGGYDLKARLSLYEQRKDFPIEGAKINFIWGVDSVVTIANNVTNKNGYAEAIIKPGVKFSKTKDGLITGKAEFAGDNKYEAAEAEVSFTETNLTISCEMVDTVPTVKVKAMKVNADGSETPLAGETVSVSVQRMFSRLPVGDVTIGDDGTGSIEFPKGIPGDSIGNLEVYAAISESEVYGNSETSAIVKWGIPKAQVLVAHRALWTQIAPLWMIISLTVLLIGVWAHYLYVIIELIIIKIKGKLVQ